MVRARLRNFGIAALLVGAMILPVAPAQALGLMTIQGRVADRVGRAVPGARVSDGFQAVYTDADGRYRLEEQQVRSYTISVTKLGFDSSSRVVTPIDAFGSVDFALTYLISIQVSPSAFNNDPPKTLDITVSSYAPPESCASWQDSTSGTEVVLDLATPVPGGQSTWTGPFDVQAGLADGPYVYTAVVRDCVDGTAITRSAGGSYIIDSVAPEIDPLSLVPLDFGDTVFPEGQPLEAKVSDALSGVDSSSIQFDLTDEAGATTSFPAAGYSPTTSWAKSNAVALAQDMLYRLSVTAADNAGNAATVSQRPLDEGGGFLTISITTPSTSGAIPQTSCSVSQDVDLATQSRAVTCENVPLDLDAISVTISGNRHPVPDVSFVEHTVPLDGAELRTSIAGVPFAKKAYPAGTTRTASMRYEVPAATRNTQTLPVPAARVNLGTLTTTVPATWTSATLEMPPTATTASTAACADPAGSSGPVGCVPDPLLHRYIVVLKDNVADPAGVAKEHADEHGASVDMVFDDPGAYDAAIPFAALAAIRADDRVAQVERGALMRPVPIVAPDPGGPGTQSASGCNGDVCIYVVGSSNMVAKWGTTAKQYPADGCVDPTAQYYRRPAADPSTWQLLLSRPWDGPCQTAPPGHYILWFSSAKPPDIPHIYHNRDQLCNKWVPTWKLSGAPCILIKQ